MSRWKGKKKTIVYFYKFVDGGIPVFTSTRRPAKTKDFWGHETMSGRFYYYESALKAREMSIKNRNLYRAIEAGIAAEREFREGREH